MVPRIVFIPLLGDLRQSDDQVSGGYQIQESIHVLSRAKRAPYRVSAIREFVNIRYRLAFFVLVSTDRTLFAHIGRTVIGGPPLPTS